MQGDELRGRGTLRCFFETLQVMRNNRERRAPCLMLRVEFMPSCAAGAVIAVVHCFCCIAPARSPATLPFRTELEDGAREPALMA